MKTKNAGFRRIFICAMAITLVLVGLMIVFSRQAVQGNVLIILSCTVNIILFFVQLLRAIKKHPFSFDMMFWLFNLFFFGYVPLLQHLTNVYTWDLVPSYEEVLKTNFLILMWSFFYLAGRNYLKYRYLPTALKKVLGAVSAKSRELLENAAFLFQKCGLSDLGERIGAFFDIIRQKTAAGATALCKRFADWIKSRCGKTHSKWVDKLIATASQIRQRSQRRSARMKAMDRLLTLAVLFLFCHIGLIGFGNLFARATAEMPTSNTTLYLLLTHGMKNTILFAAVLFVIRLKQIGRLDLRGVTAMVCLLLCCFPTAMARNMMASFYAGLLIITWDKTRKGRWFSFAIVCGLILVFPAVEIFRYPERFRTTNIFSLLASSFSTTYLGGHYDAHQMFISVQRYVGEFGISWGKQLLGALLFFVPRAVWPEKALGTGHTVITALEQFQFTNVSAPLVAEGYVNFGFVGVILFAVVAGVLCRVLDERYWTNKNRLSLVRIVYPFSMFQFFFLLRGDMMSGWAYLCGQVLVGAVIYWLVIHRTKVQKQNNG